MKFSILLALIILAVGSTLGWREHHRAVEVRADHEKLVARAAALGIALDAAGAGGEVRITKHQRADQDAEARRIAADFLAFAREMESLEKKGGPPDAATQKRMFDLMEGLAKLDAGQLKILIAEVRAEPGLKDQTRQGLIGFTIMTLAKDHPDAALSVYAETADVFEGEGMGQHVIGTALVSWAKTDPLAAAAWLKENGAKFPEISADDAKSKIIAGAASEDPALAFRLIGELGVEDSTHVIRDIAGSAATPEQRTAVLEALRAHLATLDGEKAGQARSAALNKMGGEIARGGFDSATAWLDTANLSPAELADFSEGLRHNVKGEDTGKWVGWMGENVPPEKSGEVIRGLVRSWTERDYQAAGKWLAAAPAGPARESSVSAYVEAVAPYEPETAAQWAMTLPPGKTRDGTLRSIHERWPRKDEASRAAAEDFAKKHGIK